MKEVAELDALMQFMTVQFMSAVDDDVSALSPEEQVAWTCVKLEAMAQAVRPAARARARRLAPSTCSLRPPCRLA